MSKKKTRDLETHSLIEQILELEKRLKQLGILYNQYFAGGLKRPPEQQRLQAERLLRGLSTITIKNASLRYKVQNLIGTYASMQTLWNRRQQEKETGRRSSAPRRRLDRFSEQRVRSFLDRGKGKSRPRKAARASSKALATPKASSGTSTLDHLFTQLTAYQKTAGQVPTFKSAQQLGKYLAHQKAKIEEKTGVKNLQLKIGFADGKIKLQAQLPRQSSGS